MIVSARNPLPLEAREAAGRAQLLVESPDDGDGEAQEAEAAALVDGYGLLAKIAERARLKLQDAPNQESVA